ncbi:DUF305 domain-containing protein [Gordonia sp. NPDC003585]|uniref:DUF305 domain-containing protein n=1 Tax=Gordonia sp. NPDC003585 TaxID=3154275 RepID=UPI0033A7D8DD
MSASRWSGALRIAAAASVAVLILAIGAVAGAAWQQSRHSDSDAPSTVDVGFAQDMSTHHDQAILMSRTVSGLPGVGAEIRVLADRMVLTQSTETATLRGWLQWWGEPLTSDTPMSWMGHTDHGSHGHAASQEHSGPATDQPPMPGLASVDELGRLSTLTGRAAEIYFLQLMIRHHRGGQEMARDAFNDDRASTATQQWALTMIGDQGNEIGQMTLMLKARNAEPLPT